MPTLITIMVRPDIDCFFRRLPQYNLLCKKNFPRTESWWIHYYLFEWFYNNDIFYRRPIEREIPSEIKVAPPHKLHALITLLTLFSLHTLLTLFTLLTKWHLCQHELKYWVSAVDLYASMHKKRGVDWVERLYTPSPYTAIITRALDVRMIKEGEIFITKERYTKKCKCAGKEWKVSSYRRNCNLWAQLCLFVVCQCKQSLVCQGSSRASDLLVRAAWYFYSSYQKWQNTKKVNLGKVVLT